MKNIFRLFILCLYSCMALATFESCSKKKVYNSEVEVIDKGSSSNTYVHYQGKPFTGQVWANDESCYETFENGVCTGGVIFHKNGNKAMVLKIQKYDDPSYEYYDEIGKPIEVDEFYNHYYDDLISGNDDKLPIK